MGQLGTQHCVSRWRLLPGTREPGLCSQLPGLHPALQPEEEERRAAAGLRVSAGVGRPRPGPAAAGKTPGEGRSFRLLLERFWSCKLWQDPL